MAAAAYAHLIDPETGAVTTWAFDSPAIDRVEPVTRPGRYPSQELRRRWLDVKDGSDVLERKPETPQHHDAMQPPDIGLGIAPVPSRRSRRRHQESQPVVMMQRPHCHTRFPGQFSDPRRFPVRFRSHRTPGNGHSETTVTRAIRPEVSPWTAGPAWARRPSWDSRADTASHPCGPPRTTPAAVRCRTPRCPWPH